MIWDIVNSVGRLIIVSIVVWELVRFPHMLATLERMGMALMGSAALMTIPVIVSYPDRTPFSDWASTLLTYGLVVYLVGRMRRLKKHDTNNRAHLRAIERNGGRLPR